MSEGDPLPVPPQEATSQQERLSDRQMGGLLSAMGNNEAKTILLTLMEPHTTYTSYGLYQLMMRGQGQSPGWRISHSGPFSYCKESFVNVALVKEEKVIKDGLQTTGYMKTDYGENKGTILAGLLANYSNSGTHSDVALHQLFADTQSPSKSEDSQDKKRAAITRLKIFRKLVASPLPLHQQNLADAIHETPGIVVNHLQELDMMGILNYQAIKKGESITFYRLSPNHSLDYPPSYQNRRGLTQFVYQTLLDNPDREWALADLTQLYLQQREGASPHQFNEESQKANISMICLYLVENGYIERGEFSKGRRTIIDLSPKQRQNLVDLVTLLDAFQRQDPEILAEGRTLVQYFRDHPDQVATLMKKARENSPSANRQLPEKRDKLINQALTLQPGLTIRELQKLFGLSINVVGKILREFEFPFTKEKGVKHFYPHPNSSKPVFEQEQDAL